MTLIVSSSCVVALAAVGDQALKFTIPITKTPPDALRAEMAKITAIVRAKLHASLDARR